MTSVVWRHRRVWDVKAVLSGSYLRPDAEREEHHADADHAAIQVWTADVRRFVILVCEFSALGDTALDTESTPKEHTGHLWGKRGTIAIYYVV